MEKERITIFQAGVLIAFVLFILAGMAILAITKGGGGVSAGEKGEVVIWGSEDKSSINALLVSAGLDGENIDAKYKVSYKYVSPESFENAMLEAIAEGSAPDIFLLPSQSIYKNSKRAFIIPFENYSERSFKDKYIEGAEIYLTKEGITALPFSVDPLIMYWNRDMFNNAGIPTPPRYWDEFILLAEKLTSRNGLDIKKSAFALGGFSNIENAKEIISATIFQAGSPIVSYPSASLLNAESPVYFYTEFANPNKSTYTWNGSLQNSKSLFLANNLAVYFGFASEIGDIQAKNPNLNFDVALFPQVRDGKIKATFGRFNAFAISKYAKNFMGAFEVAYKLVESANLSALASATGLPPVDRGLLNKRPTNAYGAIMYDSAFWAKTFLDPDYNATKTLFKEMIDSIVGGRTTPNGAISQFGAQLGIMMR